MKYWTILAQLTCGDWRQMSAPNNPRESLRFDSEAEARKYLKMAYPHTVCGWHTRVDAFHGMQKLKICEVRE